jgi:hypothetical protein
MVSSAGVRSFDEAHGSVRKVKPSDLGIEIEELKEKRKMLAKSSSRSHRRFHAQEWVANISFMLGVVLLAVFAAINVL